LGSPKPFKNWFFLTPQFKKDKFSLTRQPCINDHLTSHEYQ
jgi:hypothetical protein